MEANAGSHIVLELDLQFILLLIASTSSLTSVLLLWYFQIYFGVGLLTVKACGIFVSVREIIQKQFFIQLYFD